MCKRILYIFIFLSIALFGCADKHEHTFDLEVWEYDEITHWHLSSCDHNVTSNKEEHDYEINVIKPTFAEEGYSIYTCKICDYSYIGNQTPVLEHNYSNTPSFDENKHWYDCVDSGYEELKLGEENHELEDIVVQPTYDEVGYTRHQCKECGYLYTDSETGKRIDVYLVAGQSNALGSGGDNDGSVVKSDSRYNTGFDNVLYYGFQEWWGTGSYPKDNFQPVKFGYGGSVLSCGAEIGIASSLADNGSKNAIIKSAWAGTALYPDTYNNNSLKIGTWTSPSYITKNAVDTSKNEMIGKLYIQFINTVEKGITLLIETGYTPVIKGMFWMQGEAEMYTYEMSSSYEELLKSLISDVRNDVSRITGEDYSDMPFICGLPRWNHKYQNVPEYETIVQQAIINVCTNGQVSNVGYIDTANLVQQDEWHFDAVGQKYLGEQFIEIIYKKYKLK